jgi:exosortase J
MSTFPAIAETESLRSAGSANLKPSQAAGAAAVLAVFGLSTIWPTISAFWHLWTTDDLKSIGMFIPLVSFVLVLRAWRSIGWEMNGNWWGFVIVAVTAAVVHVRDQAVLLFVFSPQWSVVIPPLSLVMFAYGAGLVLLFGGSRLLRISIFPLVLLWFSNPIPHIFNVFVDLPLQHASAHVARAFAIALGQPLTPDQLRLMFTPQFGMFIAPGCNGIRGAVTMGFIALIAGYVYRFRWYAHVAVVAAAILVGYLFNFLRLLLLVLYYLVALHFTWLQHTAKMGDYIIGGSLFLIGTVLLFYAIGRLSVTPGHVRPPAIPVSMATAPAIRSASYLRFAMMLVLVLFGSYSVARAYTRFHSDAYVRQQMADQDALGKFPTHLGSYTLSRSWNESLLTGTLLYHWAQYVSADRSESISLGVAPDMGAHDTLVCHSARGEDPLWRDQLTLPSAGTAPISFSGSLFNNGATQSLEATTICNGASCGEYTSDRAHFGFVYSRPTAHSLLSQDPQRPIPILLRVETTDTTLPTEVARQQLTTTLRNFVASVDLNGLTKTYRIQ